MITKSTDISPVTLRAILAHIPAEITFADADNHILYYQHGEPPIFSRTPDILGTDFVDCHPEETRPAVRELLDNFRSSKHNTAEFWIEKDGMLVYIRYIAVRDDVGGYIGTLEVVQDITGIRKLEGEQHTPLYDT
jgi:PAS domain S-box-containing protein